MFYQVSTTISLAFRHEGQKIESEILNLKLKESCCFVSQFCYRNFSCPISDAAVYDDSGHNLFDVDIKQIRKGLAVFVFAPWEKIVFPSPSMMTVYSLMKIKRICGMKFMKQKVMVRCRR